MTSAELFAFLRSQAQSLPPNVDTTVDAAAFVAQLRLSVRPQLLELLTATAALLDQWRTQFPKVCGLRSTDGRTSWPMREERMKSRFHHHPGVAAIAVAKALHSTTMIAFTQVIRNPQYREPAEAMQSLLNGPVLTLTAEEYLEKELQPGYSLIAALPDMAIQRQQKPKPERMRRLAWNSKDFLLQMATLSAALFGGMRLELSGLDAKTIEWIRRQPAPAKAACALLNHQKFVLLEPGSPNERFDLTGSAIETCQSNVTSFAQSQRSPYRVVCPAVYVQVRNMDMISFGLDWALSIFETCWRGLQLSRR